MATSILAAAAESEIGMPQVNSAIRMMMGIGTPRNQSNRERMSFPPVRL
jgi:hypothetical protein